MDKLRIYKQDGVGYIDFYDGIDIAKYTFNGQRMGDIKISCEFNHLHNLENQWTGNEFVIYRNEKYFIVTRPEITKTNLELPYKYTFTALHEQECLKGIFFMDIVTEAGSGFEYKYFTNKTSVLFYGDITEYVSRLDKNLKTYLDGWSAVLINGTTSDTKLYSITNAYIFDSMRTANETFNIPFYVANKTVFFGDYYNVIQNEFEYGKGSGLYTITKTPSTEKPITSITGTGATENIPYFYPNATEVHGADWIVPQNTLMPPIYRETYGIDRFYKAIGSQYENQYNANFPNQYILETDIKPTIENVKYAGLNIDTLVGVAYDANDSDAIDSDNTSANFGLYLHPNFKITLPPLGFSLFDSLADKNSASIKMQTGRCAACEFKILYDENKLQTGDMPDTTNTAIELVVQKDQDTFGTLLPNGAISVNVGDKFVFLGINLPQQYIIAAETRLKTELLAYLRDNNSQKFTFNVEIDEKFLEVYNIYITLNSKLKVKFNNKLYENFIENLSINYDLEKNVLPKYNVTLKEYVKPKVSNVIVTAQNITNAMTKVINNQVNNRVLMIPNGAIDMEMIRQRDRTSLEQTRLKADDSLGKGLLGVTIAELDKGFLKSDQIPEEILQSNDLGVTVAELEDGVLKSEQIPTDTIKEDLDYPLYNIIWNPELTSDGTTVVWSITTHTFRNDYGIIQIYNQYGVQQTSGTLTNLKIDQIIADDSIEIGWNSASTIAANSFFAILIG